MSETKTVDKKPNIFVRFGKGFIKLCSDTIKDIKKITWPKPKSVFKNTGIVLLIILILGAFIFGLDTGFWNLLNLIMHVS